MIPEFPKFKKIELTDSEAVEKITSNFLPYSDFNFISMYVWNIFDSTEISQLNNNIVVSFNDYVSNKSFVSFIGENKTLETAKELIKFSEIKYKTFSLKLISEEIVNELKSEFIITPDESSYDYVYSVSSLADMNLWPKSTLSKGILQFIKKYPNYSIKQFSTQEVIKDEYLTLFKKWSENKKIKDHTILNEYKAFKRLFEIKDKNLKITALYLEKDLIGFSIYKILTKNYVISHFIKADTAYHSHVYDVLNWEEAKILKEQGVKYYNWEQDLGIPELQYAKKKYKPVFFLKKFIVRCK